MSYILIKVGNLRILLETVVSVDKNMLNCPLPKHVEKIVGGNPLKGGFTFFSGDNEIFVFGILGKNFSRPLSWLLFEPPIFIFH